MKKNLLAALGFIVCAVLMLAAVLLFIEGADAVKVKIACGGFILLMLHGCYCIFRFMRAEHKSLGTAGMYGILRAGKSPSCVFRAFFSPKRMNFRTSLSLYFILLLGLFSRSALLFWAFVLLLVAVKTALLIQYYRYWKVSRKVQHVMQEGEEIDEAQVSEFIDSLKSLRRNAIAFSFSPSSDATVGSSKYGGCPDVPDGFQWPVDDGNRPLSLLLQIDCSDLSPLDHEHFLPAVGHLYFFYELSEQNDMGDGHSVRVIYSDTTDKPLHCTDFPSALAAEFRLKECAISFSSKDSYPTSEEFFSPDVEEYTMVRWNSFDEARERLKADIPADAIGSMLGYADLVQNPIVSDLDENILLLQLSSVDETDSVDELLFGDCGSIYFYISRQRLQSFDFDHDITFELQSC